MSHLQGAWSILSAISIAVLFASSAARAEAPRTLQVTPPHVALQGNFAQCQLLVSAGDRDGHGKDQRADLTSQASFSSSNEQVVTVDAQGRLLAMDNGEATVQVSVDGVTCDVPVVVTHVEEHPDLDYHRHVVPVLTKAGCSMGACHAAQHGKGGFKLSVFGFAPEDDWQQMVRDRMRRRVDFIEPDNSLLLLKPTMQVPHGGGKRLDAGSVDYQILRAWLVSGAAGPSKDAVQVKKITVTPAQRLCQTGDLQQLRVEATYSDGTTHDVTAWSRFDSMDDGVVRVDDDGRVTVAGKGQAPIMVRFEGQAEIAMFVVPYSETVELAEWSNQNFVDELAASKFRSLGIAPSSLCDDATFVRRAFLDAIGTLPTPEETLAFIESEDPQKRELLVDRLLGLTGDPKLDVYNDAYAAYWSLKWSDLIRNTSAKLGEQGMWSLHNWIKESFRTNKPFDRFVRELVTAKGSIYVKGPANYFRVHGNASELAEATSQLFLGVRLECAKCHHHPFEKYSQDDYYSFAAFFSRVGTKNSEEFGLFGREQVVVVNATGDVRHPQTKQVMEPTPLGGEPADHPLDRRMPMADWLTSAENEWFARSVVNRYVGYLFGRGLVEPIDDMRSTNPATNVELMDALRQHFVDSGYDLKQLIRTIMTSRLYQLESQPTADNAADSRFYSHYKVKRLGAEPLLDAIDRATGVQTKFKNLPLGTRAIELPDAQYPDYFLNTFAKPKRASVCECERSPDPSLAQALHTLNGDTLAGKIADKNGRVARLISSDKSHEEIVRELYLATLCRLPSDEELAASREFLEESPDPVQCYEDLLWALINSKQFLFIY